jgi:hypothetical protein
MRKCNGNETRTFNVNPKQRARRPFPFRERVALDKPFRASLMVGLSCDIMVLQWIRRTQPSSEGFLRLVTYDIVLAIVGSTSAAGFERTSRFVYVAQKLLDVHWYSVNRDEASYE